MPRSLVELPRVALDTNLWSFVVDDGVVDLIGEKLRSEFELVVPPATILEAARTTNPSMRDVLLNALGDPALTHPLPEAATEAKELAAALIRHRPDWKRWLPDEGRFRSLEAFWTRHLPRMARERSPELHDAAVKIGRQEREQVSVDAMEIKRAKGQRALAPQLTELVVDLSETKWAGSWSSLVAAWRLELALLWWRELVARPARADFIRVTYSLAGAAPPVLDTTLADWSFIWLRRDQILSAEDWNHLWFEEVEAEELPRNWLRWATPLAQTDYKLGSGTGVGGDQQLSSYLLDLDVFLTADKALGRVLEAVRSQSSGSYAEVSVVPRNPGAQVQAIQSALSAFVDGRSHTRRS